MRADTIRRGGPRVLLVPGFVADTYSEIERSYVELSAADGEADFVWLVPRLTSRYRNYANPANRVALGEPVWVEELRRRGIPYVTGEVARFNLVANLRLFRRIFREQGIDAVYTHFGYERFWAALIGKLCGRTTIWNEHWYSLGMRFAWAKRIFYRICVDEFVAVSDFLARSLPARVRVRVIRNAVRLDDSPAAGDRDQSVKRETLGLPDRGPVVLMVAAFTRQKRHDLALEIVERLSGRVPECCFVFLGDGPTRRRFLAEVRARGLVRRVHAPGYVGEVDVYYGVADIAMLTSCNEGFGYTVLEAMRRALPVVVFDSGALPEIVLHEETGIVVPDGDIERFATALARLADARDLRLAMGQRAQRRVAEVFDRDRWIRELGAAVADAARGGARTRAGHPSCGSADLTR
jgi:glycosyltransferase involved in cell wall biosynthesis